MYQQNYAMPIGSRLGITNGDPLSTAPSYDSGATNPPLQASDGNRKPSHVLVELDLSGAGSGTVSVTLWRGNKVRSTVTIADDEAVAGVWAVSYGGTAKSVSMVFEADGLDLGVTVAVSAVNITANLYATAIFKD